MSRIELIRANQAPLLVRDRFATGSPGAIVASLAHVPELLQKTSPFLGAIYGPSAIPVRHKEIVVLRVSARMQCRFCIQTHSVVALGAGLSRDEVLALRGEAPADGVFADPAEQLLARWSDAIAPGPGALPQALADELAAAFDDHIIVELTMIAGATMMLNRYCTALELPASAATLEALAAAELS